MTDYIHHVNNVIDRGAGSLPTGWKNISGLHLADDALLKSLGWLPVVYINATFNSDTQKRTGPVGVSVGDAVIPEADSVQGRYTVLDLTPDTYPSVQAERLKNDIAALKVTIGKISDATTKKAFNDLLLIMGY